MVADERGCTRPAREVATSCLTVSVLLQASHAAAKEAECAALRAERAALATALERLAVGPRLLSFKDPFQIPVELQGIILKPLLSFKDRFEIRVEL
jgi:hypothetical protein